MGASTAPGAPRGCESPQLGSSPPAKGLRRVTGIHSVVVAATVICPPWSPAAALQALPHPGALMAEVGRGEQTQTGDPGIGDLSSGQARSLCFLSAPTSDPVGAPSGGGGTPLHLFESVVLQSSQPPPCPGPDYLLEIKRGPGGPLKPRTALPGCQLVPMGAGQQCAHVERESWRHQSLGAPPSPQTRKDRASRAP